MKSTADPAIGESAWKFVVWAVGAFVIVATIGAFTSPKFLSAIRVAVVKAARSQATVPQPF